MPSLGQSVLSVLKQAYVYKSMIVLRVIGSTFFLIWKLFRVMDT